MIPGKYTPVESITIHEYVRETPDVSMQEENEAADCSDMVEAGVMVLVAAPAIVSTGIFGLSRTVTLAVAELDSPKKFVRVSVIL